jgi:hypothetical protein
MIMKKRFTLQEHRLIGAQLESIRDQLTTLSAKVYNAYPRSDVSDDLYKATKSIDKVRSELDEQVYIENPTLDSNVANHVYYDTTWKDKERKSDTK